MALQFGRKINLIVSGSQGNGLDLSELHIVFRVSHQVTETPNLLSARVYNLSDRTAQIIAKEFNTVTLIAGYQGNYGTIFQGTIKQTRKGRENPTDTYFDIFAADAEIFYNWGFINTALSAGYSQQDVANALTKAGQTWQPATGTSDAVGAGNAAAASFLPQKAPRGKVMFGAVKSHARVLARSNGMDWSFYKGQWLFVPKLAYLPNEAVVLTSKTGLIGLPEQTQDGIEGRCLLNPALGPGTRLKIDNNAIQRMQWNLSYAQALYVSPQTTPTIANDGMYKVLFVDHVGDTRGNDWYTDFVCLAVDSTFTPVTQTILESGGIPA